MANLSGSKVLCTGAGGFLGSHLVPLLVERGANVIEPRKTDFDLRDPEQAKRMLRYVGPVDFLFHLAADVGGIGYNQAHPAQLLHDNAIMGLNLLHLAWQTCEKIVVVGTTCSYSKFCPIPFKEKDLFCGYPEETNAPYGIAKRLLLVYLEALGKEHGTDWVYAIPTNLYGEKDCFADDRSHVIPALIKRFLNATRKKQEQVTVWGTGKATRDFLYAGDCARGLALLAEKGTGAVNLGSGQEISIRDLVGIIARVTGYQGWIVWDDTKPDGQPRRLLDTTKAKSFGFEPQVSLEEGLRRTVEWYKSL